MKCMDTKSVVLDAEQLIQLAIKRVGFMGALIGVSGGIDSATSLTLAVLAEKRRE